MPGTQSSNSSSSAGVANHVAQELPTRNKNRRTASSTHSPPNVDKDSLRVSTRLSESTEKASNVTTPLASEPDMFDKLVEPSYGLKDVVEALVEIWDNNHGIKTSRGAVSYQFFLVFRMPDVATARDILHYFSSDLIQHPEMERWSGSTFYEWLKEVAGTPWRPTTLDPNSAPILIPRRKRISKKQSEPPSPSKEAIRTPDTRAKASATRQGRGRLSGKAASLRLKSTSAKKRTGPADSDLDVENTQRPTKSGKQSHFFDDGEDGLLNGESSVGGSAELEANGIEIVEPSVASSSLSLDVGGQPSEEQYRVVIRSEHIPSPIPQAQDDTWICEELGCGYIVRGGGHQEGQKQVWEHFREHEDQNERIKLLKFESKGHLPIQYATLPPFPFPHFCVCD